MGEGCEKWNKKRQQRGAKGNTTEGGNGKDTRECVRQGTSFYTLMGNSYDNTGESPQSTGGHEVPPCTLR
eukprot:NODE_11783_length_296_cov_23.267206_g10870_i0.p2 GENE.NODE_11783_length_296_cov_23.267206_g10870_i0~~NODE_11783_length_296_cov_23.267206_g10870_i0.p2  ORF type:complete len:70 (+),score=2.85 NODE_11783_length_296_cov_23.267206_g10870_i0:71-280(+)